VVRKFEFTVRYIFSIIQLKLKDNFHNFIWETEAHLTAFETSPLYKELLGKLAGILAGPPVGEHYEVSVQA
jgi:hypothetical protein